MRQSAKNSRMAAVTERVVRGPTLFADDDALPLFE
jgi:hypothetical protein